MKHDGFVIRVNSALNALEDVVAEVQVVTVAFDPQCPGISAAAQKGKPKQADISPGIYFKNVVIGSVRAGIGQDYFAGGISTGSDSKIKSVCGVL